MTDRTCEATTFEETAALLCAGRRVAGAEVRGDRVVVHFHDDDGAGAQALEEHRTVGLPTDTLTFEVNLRRAKSIIWGAKNGGATRNENGNGVSYGRHSRI